MARQRVGAGVAGPQHGMLDGQPGKIGPQQHGSSGVEIPRGSQHSLVVPLEQSPGFPGKALGDGVALGGDEALHRVGNGIESCRGRHLSRLGKRQRRIQQDHPKRSLGIPASHLLMGIRVGNERVALSLAPGAGRGGNADHGQHIPGGLAVSPVVLHAAAVGQQKVDALGAIQGTASPQSDDGVRPLFGCELSPPLDHGRIGVDVEVVEGQRLNARRLESVQGFVDVARGLQAMVGHQQRPA